MRLTTDIRSARHVHAHTVDHALLRHTGFPELRRP